MAISAGLAWTLMIFSMICWGSWGNTFKCLRGIRFELFYWDYAIGMALTAILLARADAATDGAGLVTGLATAAPPALARAAAAGVIFNIANLLLVAAIAMTGLAVAFPLAIGTALIVGTALTFYVDAKGAPLVIGSGVALAACAIVCCAAAYRTQSKEVTLTRKGVMLCAVSGLLMAAWAPLAAASMSQARGHLSPLSSLAVFGVAVLVSTLPFNLYLMRRPLTGAPVAMRSYLSGGLYWHGMGLLGGCVWSLGTAANLFAGNQVGFAVSYAIGQSAPLVASLWGIFVWKEFAGARPPTVGALAGMFIFYVAAIAVLSRAS